MPLAGKPPPGESGTEVPLVETKELLPEEESRAQEVFDRHDIDGSNTMSKSELRSALSELDIKLSDEACVGRATPGGSA